MNRRSFLRLGGLAPAMLALQQIPFTATAGKPAAATTTARPPGAAANRLDPEQAEILMAVVERIVDTGRVDAPAPREIGTLPAIEAILSQLDSELVRALRIALVSLDWWPSLMEWKFRRFRNLDREAQIQSLEGWRTSSIEIRREVFAALRNLSLLGYWSREQTWPLIGYGGPWIGEGRR